MTQVILPVLVPKEGVGPWVPVRAAAAALAAACSNAPVVCLYGAPGLGKSHLLRLARQHGAATWDDLEQLGRSAQEPLFHALQAALQGKDAAVRVVVASTAPVAQLGGLLPDVRSRLLLAPQYEVGAPDQAELEEMFRAWSGQRQLTLPPAVAAYVVTRAARNPRELQRLLLQLDQLSLAERRAITVPLARQLLAQQPPA